MLFENKEKKEFLKSIKSHISKKDLGRIESMLKKLKVMPKSKQKHSLRVAKNIASVEQDVDVILAALFHDYIERGGKIEKLPVSNLTKDIIFFLTSFDEEYEGEKNVPLAHIKEVLKKIKNQRLKNKLILIKLADRIDNLKKRKGNINKSYRKKSEELIKYLLKKYEGDNSSVNKLKQKITYESENIQ